MPPIIPVDNPTSQDDTDTVICDTNSTSGLSASFAQPANLRGGRGGGLNSVLYTSGYLIRLDFPMPFFLRNDAFDSFRQLDYSWKTDKTMVLFLDNTGNSARYSAPPVAPTAKTGRKPDDYSIGGDPLECPFDLNEDFDEALFIDIVPTVFQPLNIPLKFSPLEINTGNWALRQAIIQDEPFVQEMNLVKTTSGWPAKDCPVFSLVDCSDQDKQLILTGFKSDDAPINVHLMGRFRPDADILDMKTFKGYHEMNLFTFDNRPSTSVAHAVYEKLHGEYPSRGNVYLEFLYNEPTSIFDLPPEDSQCKIAIRPLAGDANPSMKSLWSEVESLEKWIGLLSSSSAEVGESFSANGSMLNCTTYEVSEDKLTENIKAVQDLLAQEPAIDLHRASSIEFSDSLDQVLQRVATQERADFDFTDRVWAIVRSCETIDELQECLLLIFKSVANKMYRPYLLLTNTTTMAKNLTAVMKGEMSYYKMRHPQTMIKLIVECGLRKLFQDYNFALAISHLIERGEVDHMTPSISNIPKSVNDLKRLHCILEIMCLSKERLTLTVNIQQGHVKKMLKSFSESPSNVYSFSWNEIYHFDVLPNDIRRVMTGLHPFYFKVKIDSKTLLKWATTTVVVSTERYINHKKNSGDDIHSRLYYVYLICENGRLMN